MRETLVPASRAADHHKLTWTRLRRAALSHFGVRAFRAGQMELIEAVFQGRDAFGVLPTGAGKSLCYQLPALFLPKPTLVVSPLLSLMRDQERHLERADVAVMRIDSTLGAAAARGAEAAVHEGSSSLIYITPERLENPEYLASLCENGVSLVVVDEAHCVSQWGHDFRPSYLALARAIRMLGRPPVLALTATATPEITADVVKLLQMNRPVHVRTGIARDNLALDVVRTPNEESKRIALLERVRAATKTGGGVGLVYVATIGAAEELSAWLRDGGLRTDAYHGRLPAKERQRVQEGFMGDDYDVVVATNAFGLGIDKPDVRYVVHYNFPDSLERYYQEAGRAGRDGLPARATLLYRIEDRRIQTSFLGGKYPRREHWSLVFETLPVPAEAGISLATIVERSGVHERRTKVILAELEEAKVVARTKGGFVRHTGATPAALEQAAQGYETRLEDDRDRITAVMHYAQSTECRARRIARYFHDEAGDRTDCGRCDNCQTGASRPSPSPSSPRAESATTQPRRPSPLATGACVTHPKFGRGEVVASDDERVAVRFEDGERSVRLSYFADPPRRA